MATDSIVSVVSGTPQATPIVINASPTVIGTSTVTEGGRIGPVGPIGLPGSKGDTGEQGPKGDSGGVSIIRNAAIPISGHRVVLLDTTGLVNYASNTNLSHATRVVGLSSNAATIGDPVNIAIHGEMTEPSWNWDTTKPVYLSNDGYLTQVEPVAPSAAFSMIVGFPISTTILFITLGIPITLTL